MYFSWNSPGHRNEIESPRNRARIHKKQKSLQNLCKQFSTPLLFFIPDARIMPSSDLSVSRQFAGAARIAAGLTLKKTSMSSLQDFFTTSSRKLTELSTQNNRCRSRAKSHSFHRNRRNGVLQQLDTSHRTCSHRLLSLLFS
jgi:hypothetical protein